MSDSPRKGLGNYMGHLIPTGIPNQGYSINFEYIGDGENQTCLMICECGWKTKIESFRHPWSIIETKVKVRKHMEELGLSSNE